MSSPRRSTGLTLTVLLLVSGVAPTQEPQSGNLTKNPFSQPDYMASLEETPAPASVDGPVELRLLATLVSGHRSLADINGQVLATGDTYEGYRVSRISEGRVVLVKEGQRMTLDVHETAEPGERGD